MVQMQHKSDQRLWESQTSSLESAFVVQISSQTLVLFIPLYLFPFRDKITEPQFADLRQSVAFFETTVLNDSVVILLGATPQFSTNTCFLCVLCFSQQLVSRTLMILTSLGGLPGCLLHLAPFSLLVDRMDKPNTRTYAHKVLMKAKESNAH